MPGIISDLKAQATLVTVELLGYTRGRAWCIDGTPFCADQSVHGGPESC